MTRVANCPRRRRPTSLALRASRIRWGVTKAPGFAAKLFQQHVILFLEIVDDVLLVPVHPAGRSDEEKLEVRGHEVENPSKSFAAQPSGLARQSFLVVQAGRSALQAILDFYLLVSLGNPEIFERMFMKIGSSCESPVSWCVYHQSLPDAPQDYPDLPKPDASKRFKAIIPVGDISGRSASVLAGVEECLYLVACIGKGLHNLPILKGHLVG